MGVFRNFPYSNFHEMNMDEILKILKTMSEEWNATKTEWSSYKDFIDNYFDNLDVDEEIRNKIDDMVEDGTFGAIVNSFLQPFIEDFTRAITPTLLLIGDSYNTGTGGGQNISTMKPHISKITGIPESRIYNYSEGGAGFSRNSDSIYPSFEKNLNNAINGITDKEAVTDLCVIGGANDAVETAEQAGTLIGNMNRFINKAKLHFPNAKLWLFAVGWGVEKAYRRKLMNTYRYYAQVGSFTYVKLYHHLQNKYLMHNLTHPNEDGVIDLGYSIGSALNGGNYGVECITPRTEYYYFSDSGVQTPVTCWVDTDNVYVQFSGAPSEATTPKTVSYAPTAIGMGYFPYMFGAQSIEDVSNTNKTMHFLCADSNGQFHNGEMNFRFMRRGDGLTDPVIDIYAGTFHTENGSLASYEIKRLYLASDVITMPIWEA